MDSYWLGKSIREIKVAFVIRAGTNICDRQSFEEKKHKKKCQKRTLDQPVESERALKEGRRWGRLSLAARISKGSLGERGKLYDHR